MKRIPLAIKSTSKPNVRDVIIFHRVLKYSVGLGAVGNRKKPIIRRFLRVRNEHGICHYYLWTAPDKGKSYFKVHYFRPMVEVTADQVNKHYKLNQTIEK